MTKPTTGRIVHYVDGPAPMAAIITAIHDGDEGAVDLTVFPPGAMPYTKVGVPMATEDRTRECWAWPPRDDLTNITKTAVQTAGPKAKDK